jgi:hypothetical protein
MELKDTYPLENERHYSQLQRGLFLYRCLNQDQNYRHLLYPGGIYYESACQENAFSAHDRTKRSLSRCFMAMEQKQRDKER